MWFFYLIGFFILGSLVFGGFCIFLKALPKFPRATPIAVKDIIDYFKNRKWEIFDESGIVMYGGLFGTGKTFNIVDYATSVYKRYKNIEIYSNVTLNDVPFTPFQYFEQITEPVPDGMHRIYICDEFGSLFNARNYANTQLTEAQYMTALNQLRKEKKLLLISTQRYGMVDKVFRQVCKEWCECNKLWRFMWYYRYDPYDLEYSYDPRLVKPLSLFPHMVFATDKKRKQYDTHEFVRNFDDNGLYVGKAITITGRSEDGSLTKADFSHSKGAKKSAVHKANRKVF